MTEVPIRETKFWRELWSGIYGPRKGGAKIIMDAEDAKTGAAKTSGAVALAAMIAKAGGWPLTPDDAMLSANDYISRYREHPGNEQVSAIILDDAVGSGAADARRSMSNKNVTLVRAWNMLRRKRVVTIVTVPDWNDLDSNLQKLADYRLWCQKKPLGTFKAYEVGTLFNKKTGSPITRGLGPGDSTRRIKFPNMDKKGHAVYQSLNEKKDAILDSVRFDADAEEKESPEEAERRTKKDTAQRLRDQGLTVQNIADAVGMSKGWVSEHTTAPNQQEAAG